MPMMPMPTMPLTLDRLTAPAPPRRLPAREAAMVAMRRHDRQLKAAHRGHDFIASAATAGSVSPPSAALALRWLPTMSHACRLALIDRLNDPSAGDSADNQDALRLLARWRAGLSTRADLVRDADQLAKRLDADGLPDPEPLVMVSRLHVLLLAQRLRPRADSRHDLRPLAARLLRSLVGNLHLEPIDRRWIDSLALSHATDLWRDNSPWATDLKPGLELMFHRRYCSDEAEHLTSSALSLAAAVISADNLRVEAAFSSAKAKAALVAVQSLDGSWMPSGSTPNAMTSDDDPIGITALAVRALLGAPRSGPPNRSTSG